MMYRIATIFLFTVLALPAASADNILFALRVQVPEGSTINRDSITDLETGVMDALFEAGMIVYNLPMHQFTGADEPWLQNTLLRAEQDGADFIIIATIRTETRETIARPVGMEYFWYQTAGHVRGAPRSAEIRLTPEEPQTKTLRAAGGRIAVEFMQTR